MKDGLRYLMDDHRNINSVYQSFLKAGSVDQKSDLFSQLRRGLSEHAAIEELLVYPKLRTISGDRAADHAIDEHQTVKNSLYQLERMSITDPQFESIINNMMSALNHHIQDEENNLFVQLRNNLSVDELATLEDQLILGRKSAPTHPHPSAPANAPFNLVNKIPGAVEQSWEKLKSAMGGGVPSTDPAKKQ